MTFKFSGTPDYDVIRKIEIAFVNSEELRSSIQKITLLASGAQIEVYNILINTSVESIVSVCLPNLTINSTSLTLDFITTNPLHWIYVAEVKFYEEGSVCPSTGVTLEGMIL